jgi:trigger factor
MDVSVEHPGGLARRLKVQIPAERVRAAVDDKVRRVGKNARVPGFRPGKAPLKVLYSRYGAAARQEAIGELVQSVYPEAVEQAELNPAGQPEIELDAIEADAPLAFTASFDVFPEIELAGLDEIEIKRPVYAVTDADVDKTIERIRNQEKTWEAVDREARDGDQAVIDYVGRIDNETFEGGSGEDIKVELGAGNFLPDLERAIVGRRPGEALTTDVSFPGDYGAEDLAGKTAHFEVTVKTVNQARLPELDAAFLEKLGVTEGGVDALKAKVRDSLEGEAKRAVETQVKSQILDTLHAANPIEVPASLVTQEIGHMRAAAMQRLPEYMRKDADTAKQLMPDETLREAAERRVALALLINEVIAAKGLEVDSERVSAKIDEIAADYGEDAAAVRNYYQSNQQLMSGLQAMVMEDQVVDKLLEKATVSERETGLDELLSSNRENG